MASIIGKIHQGKIASILVVLADFPKKISIMANENIPRPTKVRDRVAILAAHIHIVSECNHRYGELVKTQRVYGIVRHHIEKVVLKPGNKVKMTKVTANFEFGLNS